jgi:hypothetical protein
MKNIFHRYYFAFVFLLMDQIIFCLSIDGSGSKNVLEKHFHSMLNHQKKRIAKDSLASHRKSIAKKKV